MQTTFTLAIRLVVLVLFVVAMPVLSIPSVNRWADSQIFGALIPTAAAPQTNKKIVQQPLPSKQNLTHAVQAASRSKPNIAAAPLLKPTPPELTRANDRVVIQRLTPTAPQVDHERFHSIQSRLQMLGVDYLVLEQQSENQAAPFRFHCRMAVPGSLAYARPFEARDSNPLRAMQVVLAEVETWCASHSSTTSTKLR